MPSKLELTVTVGVSVKDLDAGDENTRSGIFELIAGLVRMSKQSGGAVTMPSVPPNLMGMLPAPLRRELSEASPYRHPVRQKGYLTPAQVKRRKLLAEAIDVLKASGGDGKVACEILGISWQAMKDRLSWAPYLGMGKEEGQRVMRVGSGNLASH